MGNRLIVATRNSGKLIELRRILDAGRVPVDVGDLDEFPDMPEVAETGLTFTENACSRPGRWPRSPACPRWRTTPACAPTR